MLSFLKIFFMLSFLSGALANGQSVQASLLNRSQANQIVRALLNNHGISSSFSIQQKVAFSQADADQYIEDNYGTEASSMTSYNLMNVGFQSNVETQTTVFLLDFQIYEEPADQFISLFILVSHEDQRPYFMYSSRDLN